MSDDNLNTQKSEQNKPQEIGFFQTILSVFAAMFGVQTKEKHQRDFEQGRAGNFIVAGIILTLVFIVTIFLVVGSVLENAGVK